MSPLYKSLLYSKYSNYLIVFVMGITVSALLYPSKKIEERVSSKYEQEITALKNQHSTEIKSYKDELTKISNENKEYKQKAELKITQLTYEIKNLQSKQKTSYFKLVKPDGTIEIRRFSESEVTESTKVITEIQEEFKIKIDQIETKWSKIHEQRVTDIKKEFDLKESNYKKTISSLEKTKTVTVNEKHFGLEIGTFISEGYYIHTTADIIGPLFLGVQVQTNKDENSFGIGLGLRF